MSSSPKYSRARIRAEQRRQLEQARRQKAEAERAYRRAETERRHQERLASARVETAQAVEGVRRQAARLAADSAAAHLPNGSVDRFQHQLKQLAQSATSSSDEGILRQTRRRLIELEQSIQEALADAHVSQRTAKLAQEAASLERLRQQLETFDTARSAKFDSAGRHEVRALVAAADASLRRNDLEAASQNLARASARWNEHRSAVGRLFEEWAQQRDLSQAAIDHATDELAGLAVDEVTIRWCSKDLLPMEERLRLARAQLTNDEFSQSQQTLSEFESLSRQIIDRAQQVQLQDDQRQYVTQGIVAALQKLGFVVQSGTPSLEYAEEASSAMILHARRIGGGAIAVSVPLEGEIWYDVDGYPKRLETNQADRQVKTCDEAQQQIEQMHAVLDQSFGIEMDELMWDGKDPGRIRKAAERLPDSKGQSRQRGNTLC